MLNNINLASLILICLTHTAITQNSTSTETNVTLEPVVNLVDTEWILICGTLVMMMTPSVGLFYGGLVKTKNMLSMIGQSLAIYAIITILWTLIGFSMAFSNSTNLGMIGTFENSLLLKVVNDNTSAEYKISVYVSFFFQMQMACLAPALIIGAVAERLRFLPLIIFSFIWHLVIYCPVAHWHWSRNGWLKLLGTHDFAGGDVIHICAGTSALAIVLFLEQEPINSPSKHKPTRYTRLNKFQTYSNLNIPSNSLVFLVLGTLLIWFGWFGFNGGSSQHVNITSLYAIINTNISPCSALITWVILDFIIKRRPTVSGMCMAILCGLVAITPCAGHVRLWAAMIIGVFASLTSYFWLLFRERYKLLDDRLDVFGCHGVSGVVGMISTGIFYCGMDGTGACNFERGTGLIYGSGVLLLYQVIGIVSTVAFSFVLSYFIVYFMSIVMNISTIYEIEKGVDGIDFGEYALPTADFYLSQFEEKIRRRQIGIYSSMEQTKLGWYI